MVQASEPKKKKKCCDGGGGSNPQPRPNIGAGPGQEVSVYENSSDILGQAKVIFMGDASVGKTSIIKAFLEGAPQQNTNRTAMLDDFTRLMKVNHENKTHTIRLNIWDAAGEGNVHDLAHLFVRDVQVGVLVYSINSLVSYQNLDVWLKHLEEHNEDFILFLVGNKSDLTSQRAVPFQHGHKRKRMIKQCKLFMETSAYTDIAAIQSLFDAIGKEIVQQGRFQNNRGSCRLHE